MEVGKDEEKCEGCVKKNELIEKYVNLIELMKKKNDHSNLSTSLKQSRSQEGHHVIFGKVALALKLT